MKAQVRTTIPEPGPCCSTVVAAFRAINVQLANGDDRSSWAVIGIVALVVALSLDVRVDRIRDPLVSAASFMLVDQRGAFAVVPHPCHQVLKRRTAVRGELVTRVPQVVNMQARSPDRFDRMRPTSVSTGQHRGPGGPSLQATTPI